MSKESLLSLLRALLTLVGTYIISHNLFGPVVNQDVLTQVIGAVIALAGAVWGFVDKTSGIEALQSAVRSVIQIVGGVFVALGKLSGDNLGLILGAVTSLAPVLQSYTSRVKMKQIAQGKIVPCVDSGKADPAPPAYK